MSTDPVADMLTRIRNGYLNSTASVTIPHTRLKENIANILTQENYLADVKVVRSPEEFTQLVLTLKYAHGKPAVNKIRRISKPGLRIFRKYTELTPILSGLGLQILSTPQGIMTDVQARNKHLGGEVLFELW